VYRIKHHRIQQQGRNLPFQALGFLARKALGQHRRFLQQLAPRLVQVWGSRLAQQAEDSQGCLVARP